MVTVLLFFLCKDLQYSSQINLIVSYRIKFPPLASYSTDTQFNYENTTLIIATPQIIPTIPNAAAEWAHLKEWRGCTCQESADTNNRLILDSNHHEMYDSRGSGNIPSVTFYMNEDDGNTKGRTTLHVLYAYPNSVRHTHSLRNAIRLGESLHCFNSTPES